MLTIFLTLGDLYQEGVAGEELVCRMASKWEKAVDKANFVTFGGKLIICGRSVNWWVEEFFLPVKDCRACFTQGLDNDINWSNYIRVCKESKQKIREKEKLVESN